MTDPVARSQRWQLFYNEEGGLRDILEALRQAYKDRMDDVQPWETGKLSALSVASKVTVAIDAEVRSIISAGTVEAVRRDHVRKIEQIPAAKRRWL